MCLNAEQQKLVECNLGYAYALASRFRHIPKDEANQVAATALCKAAKHYDPHHGAAFTTLVYLSVMQSLGEYNAKQKKAYAEIPVADFDDVLIGVIAHKMSDAKILVEQLLPRLSDDDAHLIRQIYGLGCKQRSEQEIAKEMGVSRQAINRRKQRILKALKTILEEDK